MNQVLTRPTVSRACVGAGRCVALNHCASDRQIITTELRGIKTF